jgi:hypothetical protein
LHSPVERIREFGVWQVHHVDGQVAEPEEIAGLNLGLKSLLKFVEGYT